MEEFLHHHQIELDVIKEKLQRPEKMIMDSANWRAFNAATHCHICEELLGGDWVRYHCHITGNYRGAAHNACNLKLRIYPDKINMPVVFHTLRGYDGHLIMQTLGKVDGGKLSCIPNNMEKYMTFSVGQLQFIDSLQFLNSSLDKLASSLRCEDLKITAAYAERAGDKTKLELLQRKGLYPYEYVDSHERFDEKQLPPKEAFYSKLSREGISEKDYEHA